MTARHRVAALLVLLALAASACGDDAPGGAAGTAGTTATTAAATEVAGVTTVAPLAATTTLPEATDPGDLIAVEDLETGDPDVVAQRIRYRSQSVAGNPIEVTGMVIAPADAGTERPVLAVAHGTTGMGDACAPSLAGYDERTAAILAPFVEAGFVVAATDYEGLGTPGLHPYIVGESEARGVVDSVRAAQQSGVGAGDRVVVWGHSQGGHAALHAGQRWDELAPELELLGVAAGAPPSQFRLLADVLAGSDNQGLLVMVAAGLAAAYPELDLDAILTERGREGLVTLEEGCTAEVFDYYNAVPYEEILAVEDIFADPAWSARLTENDPAGRPVPTPLLLLHGADDELLPAVSSEVLTAQLCALPGSGPVERRVYPGAGHADVVVVYAAELLTWVQDRVDGAPATDDCGG